MNITVKPHGGLNATGPQCRRCVESVGHKNFGLWYDPGNIYYYSDGAIDPVKDVETVNGLVFGMSVKDYLPPKRVDVTPGSGQVNFRALLPRLRQGGFRGGPLIVECLSPADPKAPPAEAHKALLAEARKARLFLEGLVT